MDPGSRLEVASRGTHAWLAPHVQCDNGQRTYVQGSVEWCVVWCVFCVWCDVSGAALVSTKHRGSSSTLAAVTPTEAQSLARQWIHVLRQSWGVLWTKFHTFST